MNVSGLSATTKLEILQEYCGGNPAFVGIALPARSIASRVRPRPEFFRETDLHPDVEKLCHEDVGLPRRMSGAQGGSA